MKCPRTQCATPDPDADCACHLCHGSGELRCQVISAGVPRRYCEKPASVLQYPSPTSTEPLVLCPECAGELAPAEFALRYEHGITLAVWRGMEVKPCLSCGSRSHLAWGDFHDTGRGVGLTCQCSALGPLAKGRTFEDAVTAWNEMVARG